MKKKIEKAKKVLDGIKDAINIPFKDAINIPLIIGSDNNEAEMILRTGAVSPSAMVELFYQ